MSAPVPTPHPWKFVRSGGLDQVSLETADDLRALGELDQKLWVALSCPVKGLQLDERTLALIDTDGDGHVRPAGGDRRRFMGLRAPEGSRRPSSTGAARFRLEAIGGGPEGVASPSAARWMLSKLGKEGTSSRRATRRRWAMRFQRGR